MLNWANRFSIFCLLDNQDYKLPYHSYDCLLGVGTVSIFEPGEDFFASLSNYYSAANDWMFGHFNYDIKNKIEYLTSDNFDNIEFPDAFLFIPEILFQLNNSSVSIGVFSSDAEKIYNEINNEIPSTNAVGTALIKPRITKEKYLDTIRLLKEHIKYGDCYEINFCQEFYAEHCILNPLSVYANLTAVSPNPFSALYKLHDKYLICASPERYLKKQGDRLISQPIKGTGKRNLNNIEQDNIYQQQLFESEKNRSENVMIVDLVRNDLSKICKEGTVKVTDLFGIHSFPQVHQMVSTIEGIIKEDADLSAILKATFPMGSMTGAPKKRVMELVEKYEETKRGIYSGTVGYITPSKDFDFNVVIRSLAYNEKNQYASYQVGSAITYNSNAVEEYEECLLKAEAIKKVLQ